jgi:hypothetical protein
MRYARAGRVRSPLVAACLVSAQRTSGSVCVGRGPPRTARGNDIFLSERRQQATARRRGGEQADASRSSERRERWLRRASGSCERRRAAASGERAASTQRERARSERAASSGVGSARSRVLCVWCHGSRRMRYDCVWQSRTRGRGGEVASVGRWCRAVACGGAAKTCARVVCQRAACDRCSSLRACCERAAHERPCLCLIGRAAGSGRRPRKARGDDIILAASGERLTSCVQLYNITYVIKTRRQRGRPADRYKQLTTYKQ